MIGRLNHVAIAVKDLAKATAVYRNALGAKVTDARAAEFLPLAAGPLPEAVRLVLKALDPELAADEAVVNAVLTQARELSQP